LAHTTFDTVFGWSLLNINPNQRTFTETLWPAILLGMYVETLSTAVWMFMGCSLAVAGLATALAMGTVAVAAARRSMRNSPPFSIGKPRLYEWAVLAAISEKVLFIVWQLTRTPTYFDDALQHWSGRARSLFGEVNWSFDASSPFFLGKHIGADNYPLQAVIWRALSAKLNGGWNDVISRADGLIFFVAIVGTIWVAVLKFSRIRWLAAAAAFAVSAIPLLVWHAAGGYSDIAVEAFVVAALASILRQEWLTAGVLTAGAVWSKNEGLILYFPSLLVAVLFIQPRRPQMKAARLGLFLLGFATIAPWLTFNYMHSLGVNPGTQTLGWNADAPGLFWQALVMNPTSSILWVGILLGAVYSSIFMLKDPVGRSLILAFTITLGTIAFVFSDTSAYQFMRDESTIHRTLMQFSGMAILIVTYGVWLSAGFERVQRTNRVKRTRSPSG
jgi:4-amino-4-deoxy-L-arabinose transferase-like glycosyltransferase